MKRVRFGVRGKAFLLGTVLLAAILASVPFSRTGVGVVLRDRIFLRSFFEAAARHLEYAPTDSKERDRFMRTRSDVQVEVPWDMTGYDLLDLYGLRNNPFVVEEVQRQAGGLLEGLLVGGHTFQVELN